MKNVFIVDAKRTAIGTLGGGLSSIPAHKLGEELIKHIVKSNQLELSAVNEVIMGQVLTSGQGQNPARQATINAGLPEHVPAFTVNKVCGSGLKAITLGAQSIILGDADVIIAGGQENMSLSPHLLNLRTAHKFGDAKMIDSMLLDGLTDAFSLCSMGITAENLSRKYNITRQEQDIFSVNSQNKAQKAQESGRFDDEILPIKYMKKNDEYSFHLDEGIRQGSNLETLARLKAAFEKDGTVTAGNSSTINDGAAAVLLMSEEVMHRYKASPMARIVSFASSGVDPQIMGIGPVEAIKKALAKANWKLDDIELIELNEAFAAQSLSVIKELNLSTDIINVNGGAIALGHPIGASGARIFVTLLHEMKKRNAKKAIASLCIGGGMGIAICVERA